MSERPPEWHDRVEQLFHACSQLPPEERDAWLDANEPDPEKRAGVRRLLTLDAAASGETFLPPPATEVERGLPHLLPPEPSEQPDPEEALIDGRYRLIERIGSGGAGVVYRAHDEIADRDVALKLMPSSQDTERLRHEAALLRALRLPGVVTHLEDGRTTDGRAYLVTELIEGRPFPGRPIGNWADLEQTAVALLEIVFRIHNAKFVHRDLKPGNVLVGESGLPTVLDLGISQAQDIQRGRDAFANAGTLRYMAPEQLREGIWSVQSDLFAIGAMLYEALSGRSLQSKQTAEWERAGVEPAPRPPLADVAPHVPADVCAVIDAMVARNPEARPTSAADVLERLPVRRRGAATHVPTLRVSEPETLIDLFHGPDRLLHIPSDAARVLHHRTGGEPDRIRRELDAWERAGLGHWDGDRYRISRADLERLRQGLMVIRHGRPDARLEGLDPLDIEILIVSELAGSRASDELIGQVIGHHAKTIADRVVGLVRERLARTHGDTVEPTTLPPGWLIRNERNTAYHGRIADLLGGGDVQRIRHLIEAGRLEELPDAAVRMCDRLLQLGQAQTARAVILDVVQVAGEDAPLASQIEMLEQLASCAFNLAMRETFDELLYRLHRAPSHPDLEALEQVARGALDIIRHDPKHALEQIPDPRTLARPFTRRLAVSARLYAVRQSGPGKHEDIVDDADRLATELDCDLLRYSVTSARAWAAYMRDDYAGAAALHLQARTLKDSAHGYALSSVNAASALLEDGAFREAIELIEECTSLIVERRDANAEARTQHILRAAAYRRGDDLQPDAELGEAASTINPYLGAMINLTEAAVAWRNAASDAACGLAGAASQAWRAQKVLDGAVLAEALAVASGSDAFEAGALLEACASVADRIAVQVAGLVAVGRPELRDDCEAIFDAHREAVRDDPETCLEVLSLAEADRYVHGASA